MSAEAWREVEHGWLAAYPDDAMIARCKRRCEELDEGDPLFDLGADRWIGALGEMALASFLSDRPDVERFGGRDSKPDFVIGGLAFGHKTRSTKTGPMMVEYECPVPMPHVEKERTRDYLTWACFERTSRRLLILGGMKAADFFEKARESRHRNMPEPALVVPATELYPPSLLLTMRAA